MKDCNGNFRNYPAPQNVYARETSLLSCKISHKVCCGKAALPVPIVRYRVGMLRGQYCIDDKISAYTGSRPFCLISKVGVNSLFRIVEDESCPFFGLEGRRPTERSIVFHQRDLIAIKHLYSVTSRDEKIRDAQ